MPRLDAMRSAYAVFVGWGFAIALLAGTCYASSPGDGGGPYQAYTLRHKRAAEVERVLAEMLTSAGVSAHVVVDARGNQLLVRGPETAQQIARELISTLDRPPEARPLVRTYGVGTAALADAARRVRQQFADRRGEVAVSTDPETGQLFVLAPPDVHKEIAKLVARQGTIGAKGAASDQANGEAIRQPVRQASLMATEDFVPTPNLGARRAEEQLRQMYGRRLIVQEATQSRERPAYRFVDGRGRRVELLADHSRNGFFLVGNESLVKQFSRLLRALDATAQSEDSGVRVIPVHHASPSKIREAVEAWRASSREPGADPGARRSSSPVGPAAEDQSAVDGPGGLRLASYLFQAADGAAGGAAAGPMRAGPGQRAGGAPAGGVAKPGAGAEVPPAEGPAPVEPVRPPAKPLTPEEEEEFRRRLRQLGADVQVEILPDLDAIILRGRDRDLKELQRIIEEIERLSAETEPAIDIYVLRHASGEAVSSILRQVNEDYLGGRQGRVTIMPLGKPNALLLIGWGDAVRAAKELIAKLDQPVEPRTEQRIFHLRHAPASSVATAITQFLTSRATGMGPRVQVMPDPRTNSLVVHAAPRDMAEVELLIERLDTAQTDTVLQTRVFKLYNALATDVAGTLQAAVEAARGGGPAQASAALELLAVDPKGQRLVKSGVLAEVRLSADPRLNVIIVHAPPESMELLAALIRQLDTPGAAAQIKVFRIINGDATAVANMLRSLIPTGGPPGPPLAPPAEGESALIPMRFSVDTRTNSIIAVGAPSDLRIVEALVIRLDEQDVQQRQTAVYRLKNAPALDVAQAINDFLRSQRQLQLAAPGVLSPFQQLESEVVVVPEPVSNALILSATPRFFKEIADLIEKLDSPPPQVMIQVLIAEVQLSNNDEFGVEFGLQDSILFDRSLLSGNLTTITQTLQQSTPAGIITQTTQSTPFATLNPGFNFNTSDPLGNSASVQSLAASSKVGTQGLTSFGVGRVNNELGFGGLVLSASSESVSVLIRALQATRRLEVLSRPQIMTMDNQPAFIQIGQRVPRISSTGIVSTGQFNAIDLVNIGLILGVTPRISPEGMVVMEIDAENSNLAPISEGIPVTVAGGQVIRSPTFNTTMAQTTVSAADGETIVLGGLITKGRTRLDRRVPLLADIPVLGALFRYHNVVEKRTELLIVLTPHIVRTPEEAERVKRLESARMTWCLGDVEELHGEAGLTRAGGTPEVIYPDITPRGKPAERSAWEIIAPREAKPEGPAGPDQAPPSREQGPPGVRELPERKPTEMPPPEPIPPGVRTDGPRESGAHAPWGASPTGSGHPEIGSQFLPGTTETASPRLGNPLRPAPVAAPADAQPLPARMPSPEF